MKRARLAPKPAKNDVDAARRRQIVEAGLRCLLTFGYAKTSLDDIAKEAGISRPLIYLKFKNKQELFLGIYDSVMSGLPEVADAAMAAAQTEREKLMAACEALVLTPWDKLTGFPRSAEFFKVFEELVPDDVERYNRLIQKYAREVLGDKEAAEVFALALKGLQDDVPSTKTLRRRLDVLVERFAD
jgi:AcrR family transcriptional regulator